MNWYHVAPHPDRYDYLEFLSQKDSNLLFCLMGYESFCQPDFPPVWSPVNVNIETRDERGDFFSISAKIAATSSAKNLINEVAKHQFDSFLIRCNELSFYVISPHEIDCLDESKSEVFRYQDGGIRDIKKFSFKPEILNGIHMFRLPHPKRFTFISEILRDSICQSGYNGLKFKSVQVV